MANDVLERCPRCGGPLTRGLSNKACGLSFVAPQKLEHFAFADEDLNERSLATKLFVSRARFCPSYLCRACHLYLVDYGEVLSRPEAQAKMNG